MSDKDTEFAHIKRRSLAGPLVKSFLFVVVTALATTVLGLSIANTGVGTDATTYKALFTDVTGLVDGDGVRISGVKVGEVTDVRVVDRRTAQVTFTVTDGRHLPGTTTAAVKYLNMVGQRYVSLERGAGGGTAELADGDTIPLARTTPALDLTLLFNGFKPLFEGLSPRDVNDLAGSIVKVLQGEGGTVDSLIQHVGSLSTTVAAKDKVIGEVVGNLTDVLTTINDREDQFDDLVTTLQKLVSGFDEDRKPLGDAVEAMGDLTTVTAGFLQDARKPLKDDIHQLGRLSTSLGDGIPQIQNFLDKTPTKLTALSRLSSYGSWFNLYLCEAKVGGLKMSDGSKPPTGISVTEARCQ
ncbi:MCE family protein [Streptomyces kunmingensis]|uniref:MCE family protein n=1 Tax=Streptomyces kunmingensis TaxID=68225 RepID=A0ABU6C4W6_9ACTN|nr:MlaD family protein [Streptomyces kunmingensis]MEB3959755.1 MCE family protein [Streptomyces kunmingensis]